MSECSKNTQFLEMIHQESILHDKKGQCFLASFFSTEQIWFFQVIFSSNNTPRNSITCVLSIALLAIFNSGSFRGILSLTELL